jgi:hypothetical protein
MHAGLIIDHLMPWHETCIKKDTSFGQSIIFRAAARVELAVLIRIPGCGGKRPCRNGGAWIFPLSNI